MNENEIKFFKYFEENLFGKSSSSYELINNASKLLGRSQAATCPTCAREEYYELLNIYNSCLTKWKEYKDSLVKPVVKEVIPEPDIEIIYTKYESVEEVKDIIDKQKDETTLSITKKSKW